MPTNHELTTHVADKETLLKNCHYTLEGKTEKPWGQHLLQIVLSTVWVKTRKKRWKRIIRPWKYKKHMSEALHLQVPGQSGKHSQWAQTRQCHPAPWKLNPCPSVCYLHALTKAQGKWTWSLPKNLAKALDNYLAKEGYLEDIFSNKPSGTINPVYLPQTTPEEYKERVIQKNTVCLNSCPKNYPATSKEHPISNHDLDRVQCWKTRSGHVGTLTNIVPSAHSDVMVSFSEGAMSLKRTLLNGDRYAHCLTGAVLLQLSYPDRFDWSFSSTLQGARLESFLWFDRKCKHQVNNIPDLHHETSRPGLDFSMLCFLLPVSCCHFRAFSPSPVGGHLCSTRGKLWDLKCQPLCPSLPE